MKALFPLATKYYVLAFQFSSWYPLFTKHTIKSTIIRPLSSDFWEYLDADGVFVPVGSENTPSGSTLSDDDDEKSDVSEDDDADLRMKQYAFPELDRRIRECIVEYDAVFPKLNFSSPKVRKFIPDSLAFIEDVYPGKDASWLLHSSTPLKCTSPADVYLLLKCSDFVNHDLLEENVFEGCDAEVDAASQEPEYELELVLRKWYPVDSGRELRCFVRDNALLGFSQRDTNYYEFWNQQETRERVVTTVKEFWEQNIRDNWTSQQDYIFDFLLTRDLSRGHILDFNPYMTKTDSLLFTYEELRDISESYQRPILRVIDSPSHPAAIKNAPVHQHNMIPFDAIDTSNGCNIEEFSDSWNKLVKEGFKDFESEG